jgi:hypothetical protein
VALLKSVRAAAGTFQMTPELLSANPLQHGLIISRQDWRKLAIMNWLPNQACGDGAYGPGALTAQPPKRSVWRSMRATANHAEP